MREPARIARMLSALEHYWRRYPDLRLGQIVGNFSTGTDPYYIEDDDLCLQLERAMFAEHVSELYERGPNRTVQAEAEDPAKQKIGAEQSDLQR